MARELKTFLPALVLLMLAVLINYADRGSLSLAAPLLKSEWHLSTWQLGILLSSFFWTYVALQLPVGWLVDRFNASTVLATGYLIWSISTACMGLASGFTMLLLMRLLLGAGEAVMFPASSKICSQQLPEHARGFANALIVAAIRWGTAVGTFGGGLLMAHIGWRKTFLAVGLAGLLWLPAWGRGKPKPVAVPPLQKGADVSVAAILRLRSFWGAATGHFCGNYLLYFLMVWLPFYLVQERHLSMELMAGTAGVLYAIESLSAILTGWIADRRIRRGDDARTVRKWSMVAGFFIATLSLLACAFAGPHTYLWFLLGAAIGSGAASSGVYAMGQTLAGPRLAGRWIGLQNCLANIAGVIGPPLTGFLVDKTGHFGIALTVAATVTAAGGFAWVLGIRRSDRVDLMPSEVFG